MSELEHNDMEKKEKASSITVENVNVRTYTLSPEMRQDIKESIIHTLHSDPELVREIFQAVVQIKNESHEIKQKEEIELKRIEKAEAKKLIHAFIESNPGCKTSDIIVRLELDPPFVMEILKELKEEDLVQSKNIV